MKRAELKLTRSRRRRGAPPFPQLPWPPSSRAARRGRQAPRLGSSPALGPDPGWVGLVASVEGLVQQGGQAWACGGCGSRCVVPVIASGHV